MNGQLVIGTTTIAYAVRESSKAKALRVVVTPGRVEVVAPVGSAPEAVDAFLARKRRWLFNAVRDIDAAHTAALEQQYRSGAKVEPLVKTSRAHARGIDSAIAA